AAPGERDPMAPVGPVELAEVRLVLAPGLRDVPEPPPRRRYGRVFVGTTRAARGMAFDTVFVPGLAENVFPGKILEDPLLLDERRRMLGPGTLVTDAQRVEAERLALPLAAGAGPRPRACRAVGPWGGGREGAAVGAVVLRARGAEGGGGTAAWPRRAHAGRRAGGRCPPRMACAGRAAGRHRRGGIRPGAPG